MKCLICTEPALLCSAVNHNETFCNKACASIHYELVGGEFDENLPNEVLFEILYKLSPETLLKLSKTNSRLRDIINDMDFKKMYAKKNMEFY